MYREQEGWAGRLVEVEVIHEVAEERDVFSHGGAGVGPAIGLTRPANG